MKQAATILLIAFSLTILQIGFVSLLPFPFSILNLILAGALFTLFALRFSLALYLILASGFLLELYALTAFGLLWVSLFLTIIIAQFLFNYFFTNRSWLALVVLGAVGTLIFRSIFLLINFLLMIKGETSLSFSFRDYALSAFWETILNVLFLLSVFLIAGQFVKKLKSVFLVR